MASWLDQFLNGGQQNVSVPSSTTTEQPAWYQDLLRGIAGNGVNAFNRGFMQNPNERQADMTPDQLAAQAGVRGAQGQWTPAVQGGLNAVSGAMPQVQGGIAQAGQYGAGAVNAASGPASSWTDNFQQYMSPYTSSVVNEIGRLGNQNLNENIIPGINDQFIGSGGFGSERNATMLGRGIRDAQTNISGLQSAALQAGYGTSANIFANDANRQQQQQQMLTNANIGAGGISNTGAGVGASAAIGGANAMGGLAQIGQGLGYGDINALFNSGTAQQGFNQQGLDILNQDWNTQQNWDMNQLGGLSALIRGQQLPSNTTGMTTTAYPTTSPLQWLNALGGIGAANGSTTKAGA